MNVTSLRHRARLRGALARFAAALRTRSRPRWRPRDAAPPVVDRARACRRCPIRPTSTASRRRGKVRAGGRRTTCRASTCRTSSRTTSTSSIPATFKVIDKFKVGLNPQHVVPSWDLSTLWVANNAENTKNGSVMPIDPKTGKVGKAIPVDDPYNMYFSPDGKSAIVVAEALQAARLPRSADDGAAVLDRACRECAGINHADFSIDGRYAIFTCEFAAPCQDRLGRKVLVRR